MIQKKLETGEFLVEYNEKNSKRVILVCPGLVYYKSGPHFWLSNLINKIANSVSIISFDYYGEGDSEGEWSDVSFTRACISARNIINYIIGKGYEEIIVLSTGIGNIVINEIAAEYEQIHDVFLIDYYPQRFERKEEILNSAQKADAIYFDSNNKELLKGVIGLFSNSRNIPINKNSFNFNIKDLSSKVLYVINNLNLNGKEIDLDEVEDLTEKKWGIALEILVNKVIDIMRIESVEKKELRVEDEIYIKSFGKYGEIYGLPFVHNRAEGHNSCVIYEPGLGGDRVDHMRMGVLLEKRLVQIGFDFFRYDYTGSGIAKGEFYNYSWTNRIDYACRVIESLKDTFQYENMYMISYSEGAKLLAWISTNTALIKKSVMLSPVLNTGNYNYLCASDEQQKGIYIPKFVKDSKKRLCLPIQGFLLGTEYFREQKIYDFYKILEKKLDDKLIIYGENDDLFEKPFFENNSFNLYKLKNEEHLYSYKGTLKVIDDIIHYFQNV